MSLRRPKLVTPLPGPKTRAIVERSSRYLSTSYTQDYPLVAESGKGSWITDPDGNEFLDFTSGIAVCSTGHAHPHVVAAITAQAQNLLHMSGTDFYYPVQAELVERLAALQAVRDPNVRVYFGNSGAEANEAAMKLARYHTGRSQLLAFYGSFHGRTMGALSLTASKARQRERFAPFVPGVHHALYPNPLRHGAQATQIALDHLDLMFRTTVSPDELAAVFVEPIQGEGGYLVPPDDFLVELRRLADRHRFLVIYDEVQSGMGRTGKMFAWQHVGVAPDIISLAKGIASGLPLSAVIASADVMTWKPGAHASTFGGNPVACAAACATLDLLGTNDAPDGLIVNAARSGEVLRQLLLETATHPRVAEVRGRGLMLGMELVKDRKTMEPDPDLRNEIVLRAFDRGLLILGCGHSTIRFAAPLVVTADEARVAVEIFTETLYSLARPS